MRIESLIQSLDTRTRKKARSFLISPYFNTNETLVKCFDYIDQQVSRGQSIDKQKLWVKLFGKTPYKDIKLRKIFHDITQALRSFFAVESLMAHPSAKLKSEIDFCKNHNIIELHNRYLSELNEQANETSLSSRALLDIYFSAIDVGDLVTDSRVRDKGLKDAKIFDDFDLLKNVLYTGFLTEVIRLTILKRDHDSIRGINLNGSNDFFITEQMLREIGDHVLSNDLLEIYLDIHKSIFQDDQELDSLAILEALKDFGRDKRKEIKFLYEYLNNYLTRQSNLGNKMYFELFMLYKFGLQQEYIVRVNQIDAVYYENIVMVACRSKEYSWALNFIDEYYSYLAPEYRQSAYSFSKARIYNNMGNHDEVIKVLMNVEYENLTYKLNSRIMLMMAFYELDELDPLDSTIKSFKVFLRRNRNISSRRKNNFRDFCDVVFHLVKAIERKDKERVKKALTVMNGNPGIPSSWWLKEKIQEVKDILKIKDELIVSTTPQ